MTVEVVLLIITEIVKVVTAATVLVTTESITAATGTIPGATTERITIDKITVTMATDRRTTTETTIGESETTCSCNLYKSFTLRHIGSEKTKYFPLPGTEITVTVTWKGSGSLKITMTVVLPKSLVHRIRDRGLE